MNPLSWFKEFALRSQTADVMSGIRDKAHADAQANLMGLHSRKLEEEDLQAKIDATLEGERIQQAGLTERENIESIRRAAERAAQFEKDKIVNRGRERDDLSKLDTVEAINAFAAGAQYLAPEDVQAAIADAKARAARLPVIDPDKALYDQAGQFSTGAALRELMKDPAFAKIAQTPRFQAMIRDAQAKDAERESIRRNREKPAAAPSDGTSPDTIESTIRQLEGYIKELRDDDPNDPRIPKLEARVQQHTRRLNSKLGSTGGANESSALLKYLTSPEFMKK